MSAGVRNAAMRPLADFLDYAVTMLRHSKSSGQVAERLNALVSKTSMAFGSSWVRIPPCPLPLPRSPSLGDVVFEVSTGGSGKAGRIFERYPNKLRVFQHLLRLLL
tara:strand:+ start:1134 stop:1451 length:318 start_codon:yes stop_codon:yes gene_type:complete